MSEAKKAPELPSDREMRDAISAFEDGDFESVVDVMRRKYEWHAHNAIDTFDREVFITGAKSNGHNVTEQMIRGTQKLSNQIRDGFRKEAKETAEFLAKLHRLLMEEDQAFEWEAKAKIHTR